MKKLLVDIRRYIAKMKRRLKRKENVILIRFKIQILKIDHLEKRRLMIFKTLVALHPLETKLAKNVKIQTMIKRNSKNTK